MVCMKGRGTALKPRADLRAGEGGTGVLEPPLALETLISLCPRQQDREQGIFPKPQGQSVGVPGWMVRCGWSDHGLRLPCGHGTACECDYGPVSSSRPNPLLPQHLPRGCSTGAASFPRQVWVRGHGVLFRLNPWWQEPAGLHRQGLAGKTLPDRG